MPATSINNSGTLYVTGALDEVSLGTGSILFNGTNQYLTATVPTPPRTGSLTYECWFYTLATSTGQIIINTRSGDTTDGIDIGISASNQIECTYSGSVLGTATTTIVRNRWYHVAVVRNGASAFTIYINGVAESTFSNSTNFTSVNLNIGFTITTTKYFNGYISNVRIVNGAAVYTSNFNPSTGPLTPVFNTLFLLNTNSITNSSVYNLTITNTNSAISTAFNPFYIDYSLGSISLNGTNQYLTVAGSAAFAFATGDFTVELWIYPTSATWSSSNTYLWDITGGNVTLQYFQNQLSFYNSTIGVGSALYATAKTIPTNTWTHIAIARQSGTTRMFVNGTLVASAADSFNATQPGTVYFGVASSLNAWFPGYMSNIRVVKGAAVYTGNFTPSPRPLINTVGTLTSILLNTSAISTSSSILDSSPNNVSVTPVGSPVNSINNPFINYNATTAPNTVHRLANTNNIQAGLQTLGEIDEITMAQGSIFFNGTSAVLTSAAATALTFGTSNFTVEFWVYIPSYVTSDANEKDIIEGNPSSGSFQIYIAGSGQGLRWGQYGVGGNIILAGASIPVGRWFHVAVSRIGTGSNQTFGFINGSLVLTVTDNTNYSGVGLGIGGRNTGANYFAGYISNLRCVNGTALYTNTFTPATTILELVPNTSLLLRTPYTREYLKDFSSNSFVLTNTGGATSTGLSPFATIGSLRYNASTQALSFQANNAFAYAGDFTIEGWWYSYNTALSTPQNLVGMTASAQGFDIRWYGNGGDWQISLNSGAGTNLGGPAAVSNTWYHVAVVRSSGIIRAFINGIATTNVISNSSTLGYNNYPLGIGNDGTGGGNPLNGHISNLRIINGVAVYSTNTNFNPPTQPLTAIGTQTVLLLNTPASLNAFKDFSSNNFTATIVGNTTSTIFNPFFSNLSNPASRTNTVQRVNSQGLQVGGYFDEFSLNRGSTFFNGSSQYLTVTGSNLTLPTTTTPFTVEAWVNVNAFTGVAVISSVITSNVEFAMGFTNSASATDPNLPGAYLYVGRFSAWTMLVSPTPAVVNTWYHIATSFDGTTTRLFLNGALVKSGSIAWTTSAIGSLYIGRRWDAVSSIYYSGYISNVRFVKGAALYTADFTPPTRPLEVYSTNTSLLLNTVAWPSLNLKDSSPNNYTVTPNGSPPPSELNPFTT